MPEREQPDGKGISYASSGVDYGKIDPSKRTAQDKARSTANNLERFGYREVPESRGESAYVWEEPDKYGAFLVEGLGTKNLIADAMRKITGRTYYDQIAQDDVAMIVNDLVPVGAKPLVVNAYFAAGSSDWFFDEERMSDLTDGFANACNRIGAAWGGGESPALRGVIESTSADLAGAGVGEIKPKKNLVLGQKLTLGDRIVLVESSGIHANGSSLVRGVVGGLPDGYATQLSDGRSFGEAVLTPTHLYGPLMEDLFKEGVDIHYMANITGHGWRKLMRPKQEFSYEIDQTPPVPEEFALIQRVSGVDDREMYGNLNMGIGFAFYVPERYAETVTQIARENHGMNAINAGEVKEGPKQVVIKPRNLVLLGKELGIR